MTPPEYVPRPVDDESVQQPVIMLGGALEPAEQTFRPLRRLLDGQVRAVVKDLEATMREPAHDYGLDIEVDALLAVADEHDWERFQVVGFGEGASVALVAALRHPARVLSLGLDEPVWAGNREPSGEETAFWGAVTSVLRLEDTPLVEAYAAVQLRPEAQPSADEADLQPPPTVAPPEVPAEFAARRGPALRALWRAFAATDLDYRALVRLPTECYVAVGADSNVAYEALARRLHGLMRDMHVEVYEGRSHLDPPHDAEAERFALALAQLWRRSMRQAVAAGAPKAGTSSRPPHFA